MKTRNGTEDANQMQMGTAASNQRMANQPFTRRMNTGSSCTIAHRLFMSRTIGVPPEGFEPTTREVKARCSAY